MAIVRTPPLTITDEFSKRLEAAYEKFVRARPWEPVNYSSFLRQLIWLGLQRVEEDLANQIEKRDVSEDRVPPDRDAARQSADVSSGGGRSRSAPSTTLSPEATRPMGRPAGDRSTASPPEAEAARPSPKPRKKRSPK